MPQNIKFIASGSSTMFGNFAPGDIAKNVDPAHAKHMVEDCKAAVYVDTVPKESATSKKQPRKNASRNQE